MTTRPVRIKPKSLTRVRALALATLSIGAPTGCGREFFRQWANQDASEAVFEKSRDPRWRLDLFTADPPALARYADPYDPDTPPAPPDDYATQSLSPVPQWPYQRLLVPPEGTGYIDLMEQWQTQNTPAPTWAPGANEPVVPQPATPPPVGGDPGDSVPPVPPPVAPGPFVPGGNSGPNPGGTSPNSLPGPAPANPIPPEAMPPQGHVRNLDLGVRLAAFQETGLPMPVPPSSPSPEVPPGPRRDVTTPPIGMDPDPSNTDLSAPVGPRQLRPDLSPDQYRASEAMGSEVAGILVPGEIQFDESEAAGYPRGSHPYVVTMQQAFHLTLINSRTYQFRLENIYLAALAVTLQRFQFQPQFYAGLSPVTGVATGPAGVVGAVGGGFPPPSVTNSFNYATRATGAPNSSLSLGTVAGVGKTFGTGAHLLGGFANQLVFNFLGKHPIQPSDHSFLPLNFVQPFLRGGGRAVTLEPLTNAERNLVYELRTFAKFRQEFTVATLVGGVIQTFGTNVTTGGFSAGGGTSEPAIGFINLLQDIQEIENDRKNIAAFEQLTKVYDELKNGEASGLSQLQVDQVNSGLQTARRNLVQDRLTYRQDLDQFKIQMGLPPDTPLVPDRSLARSFKTVFDGIDNWQRDPKRDLADLPKFANQLPRLDDYDIIVDGRSILGVYNDGKDNEDKLEDLLLAAERTALEHRLDLMNARAQLYDAWRQIRVAANALRGVLNVALTNTYLTPPNTTNPFGFIDQAKQFSLVINAELPLVRLNERNNFRSALIGYQRQRRLLMNNEDFLKYQVRNDVRTMQTNYLYYEIARRNFVLTIRQKDQSFENIIAPPAGGAGAAQANSGAIQTTNLINFQNSLLGQENALVAAWYAFIQSRLIVYRDLGTLPIDEWEAFNEVFPPDRSGPDVVAGAEGAPRAEAPRATEVLAR